MKLLIPLIALALAACGATTTTVEKPVIVHVPVKAPCPSAEETARLKAERPKPLRDQPMPPTAEERVAQTSAQLGDYEAPGRWGDQVVSALDRCQAK